MTAGPVYVVTIVYRHGGEEQWTTMHPEHFVGPWTFARAATVLIQQLPEEATR